MACLGCSARYSKRNGMPLRIDMIPKTASRKLNEEDKGSEILWFDRHGCRAA